VRLEDLTSRDIVTSNIVHRRARGLRHPAGRGDRRAPAPGPGRAVGDKITVTTHRLNESGTIAPRYADYECWRAS
jgi:lipoprotein-releasing system permease protein